MPIRHNVQVFLAVTGTAWTMLAPPMALVEPVQAAVIRSDPSATLDLDREMRVARVGYRLAHAAAGLCERPEPMTGMILHDIGSYPQAARPTISNAYGLTWGFGVRAVVPDSAAARAGIRAGDEIVAVGDTGFEGFSRDLIRRDGSSERTERFLALLDNALATAVPVLMVRRGDTSIRVPLAADMGCSARFVVAPDKGLNAWSDGVGVAVTSRLVDFVANDDELAFVLGHEMSHNILRHAARTKGHSTVFAGIGIGAGLIKATEIEADSMAARLMVLAHYDTDSGEIFLHRLAKASGPDIAITHPGTARRIETIRAARKALESGGDSARD